MENFTVEKIFKGRHNKNYQNRLKLGTLNNISIIIKEMKSVAWTPNSQHQPWILLQMDHPKYLN